MASDEWIQESLARVEALDNERGKLEEALEEASDAATIERLSKRLDALEAEHAKLMQALESAAEEGGGDDDDDAPVAAAEEEVDNDAPTGLFSRDDMARMAAEHAMAEAAKAPPKPAPAPAPPPKRAPTPVPTPQAAPPPQAPPSFPAPAFPTSFPSSMGDEGSRTYRGGDLDDDAPKSKGPLLGIVAAAVVALGVVAYIVFGRGGGGDEDSVDPAAGPKKVIGGGVEVPPDTQGPKAAKGADVDSVAGTQFKEGQRPAAGTRPSGGTSGSSTPTKKKPDDKTKIVNTDDPLAGIDTK